VAKGSIRMSSNKKFSFVAYAIDKDDCHIEDALPEMEWMGDKARLWVYKCDEKNEWVASGICGLHKDGNKYGDYELTLKSPQDWIDALQWVIKHEEA
jgi:hypothetical protein